MRAVVFSHPDFLNSTSMPLFAKSIVDGLRSRGVSVSVLKPRPLFFLIPAPKVLKKWLGYIDQFLIFPILARMQTRNYPADTIYIFADQALGPWIPAFANRLHAIHCHDLLALRSAVGEIPNNPVPLSGRLYQKWIQKGFNKGKNFICVSHRSSREINRFLHDPLQAKIEVVHNGLNYPFHPMRRTDANAIIEREGVRDIDDGFILHVGGNQWYKNRLGVLEIYADYVSRNALPLPLMMIGAPPTPALIKKRQEISAPGRVIFVNRPSSQFLHASYSVASVLLFPSIAEGFGWPIIEAMACGCVVLTTNDSPMTEAGGDAAIYLPSLGSEGKEVWASECASILESTLASSMKQLGRSKEVSILHASQFNQEKTIDQYVKIYKRILNEDFQ